jgi:hypothetical protein
VSGVCKLNLKRSIKSRAFSGLALSLRYCLARRSLILSYFSTK